MSRRSVAPLLGDGLVARRLVVRARDVGFLKGIVEAHEGLAVVFAESGGELTLASAADREAELDALVRDLADELQGIAG
jgi:hypothetical protein